jgi:hypothetical protein
MKVVPEDRPTRHPEAVAFDEWLLSEEGQRCSDRHGLGGSVLLMEDTYLKNRLWYAFMAGVAAGSE